MPNKKKQEQNMPKSIASPAFPKKAGHSYGLTEKGRQMLQEAADAAAQFQEILNMGPLVGRISFASGEQENFTDSQKYLQTVREELSYQATTGFRCETLTDDPAIRKAVDDMLCDLYGEENPRQVEDYGGIGMTMGGMSG